MKPYTSSMLTLRHLRHFVAVAQSPTITAAASELAITQPALTESIRQVENLLDCKLFDRSSKRLKLTGTGQAILPIAERVLHVSSNAIEDMYALAGQHMRTVRVGLIPSVANRAFSAMAKVADEIPEIEFDVTDAPNNVLMEDICSGKFDIVIGVREHEYKHNMLNVSYLFDDKIMAVMHREDKLASFSSITWKQLVKCKLATFRRGNVSNILNKVSQELRTQIKPSYRTEYTEPLYEIIRQKFAIAVLPKLYTDAMTDPTLVVKPVTSPVFKREIALFSLNQDPYVPVFLKCRERLYTLLKEGISYRDQQEFD